MEILNFQTGLVYFLKRTIISLSAKKPVLERKSSRTLDFLTENLVKIKIIMLPVVCLIFVTVGLCVLLMAFSRFFAPKARPSPIKFEDYECGVIAPKRSSTQAPVKFFLTAILFILFDIEIIFLYPFALAYRDFLLSDQGLAVLLAMLLFILVFIFGLWWEIKTKALDWK